MATNVLIVSGEIKNDYHTLDNSVSVSSGGTAINTSVDSGGHLIVGSGGLVSRSRVSSGGFLIGSGGTAIDTKVFSNGIMKCSSGFNCSVTRTEVFLGGYFMISHGAVVDSTTLSGQMQVYSGGIANITTVFSSAWCCLYYGAIANDTVLKGGHLYIESGGVANNTTIDDHGILEVSSGGVANNTTIDDHGLLEVSSGGVANNATVNPGGRIRVVDGSMTGIVENGGSAFVSSNATVSFAKNAFSGLVLINNRATVHSGTTANINTLSGGELEVFSGGTANSTTLRADGELFVYSGGTASNTTISSGGFLDVQGWGARNAVSSGGVLKVYSGGSVFNDTVCSSGAVKVSAFGLADHTTVSNGGWIEVYSGGTANSAAVCFSGRLNVYDNGTANSAAVSSGGSMVVDGVASRTKIFSGGSVSVPGTVISTTVSGGDLTIPFNGTANSTTVSGGNLVIRASAVVTDTAVNSDGILRTSGNDCKLTRTTVNSGGTAVVQFAPIVSDMVVNGGELQVLKGATMAQDVASDLTVTNSGHLLVSGWVNGAVVDSKGKVTVESGGMFKNATVTNGSVTAKTGASVSGLTLSSGGSLNVSSGGIVSQTTVSSGGVVTGVLRDAGLTFSGGTLDLNIAKSSENDDFLVDAASYSGFKSGTYDVTLTVANKQLNGTYNLIWKTAGFNKTVTVQNAVGYQFGTLTVGSGPKELLDGVTYDLKLDDGDLLVTVTGGAIPDPIVSGITLIDERRDITSGMSAIDVKVSAGGILNVFSKGSASNTTVYDGGEFNVNSGGRVEGITIEKGGSASIFEDVMAENVVVNGGIFSLEQYGWAQYLSNGHAVSGNTVVRNGGQVIVHENAYLVGAYVSQGGRVDVLSDGTFETGRVNGAEVYAFDGALVSRVDLESGGILNVESGGRVQHINVSAGGVLTGVLREASELTFYGGTLDLDISTAAPEGEFLIDEQSYSNIDMLVSDKIYYLCTLTVDGNQANGAYRLIEDAYGFDKSITVKSASGAELGTLTVGQTAEIGGASYTLNLSDDYHLTVTVSGAEPPPPTPTPGDTLFFAGDFNGDLFDTLAVQKNSTVTIYQNGEAWGIGLTLDPGWTVVGTGDFSGDGLDDFLRVNDEGYVVGEMSNGNGTFTPQVLNLKNAGWDILGTGNFDGIGADDVLIANPTAASETVGLLGYWKSGTEWTLINGYSPEWTMVSTGDFNGDGKCDMLWKNEFIGEGGLTYNAYCTWIVEDPVDWRMVSVANPAEWNFLCSGDFDGNGSHDIAMINDVGVVGIWGVSDGYLSSWSILSAVTSEWQLAGVADFNADGTDDIAWSNADTGLTGYWQINDKTLTTWANIATL